MNVNNSYGGLLSRAGQTASQVAVDTGHFVSKSVKNTASVALWSIEGFSNISKKIVPTILGVVSAASAWDVYAYVTGQYSPLHGMNAAKVHLPLWTNAMFSCFGPSRDDFSDPDVVSKFFHSAPYLAVGSAIAAYASYELFNKLESGSKYLATSIHAQDKKPISVTVISLGIEIVQEEKEAPAGKSSWIPSVQPVKDAFKKVFSFEKQKTASVTT